MQPLSNASDIEALKREFGIIFDTTSKTSQFGGLSVLLGFLERGRFYQRLSQMFGVQKARTALQILIGIIAGAGDMEEVARIAHDPLVAKFFKKHLLSAVGATQLTRDLKDFSKPQIEQLHSFVSNIALAELAQELPHGSAVDIDVDATAVEKHGEQEGVEDGYIEKDKIDACYQYLFFRVHQFDTILYGTIRGGACHSQNGFCDYLRRFLPLLAGRYRTTWRADSGYYNEQAFNLFSQHDCTFFIKAPMSQERALLAATSRDLVWHHDEKTKAEFCSYITKTKEGTIFRLIFKRAKKKAKQQLSLLTEVEYKYDCLATNDLVLNEAEAYLQYNPRANIENNNREFKNDYFLGKLVTADFDANDVITQITILSYVIMAHIKRKHLPREMRRYQLSTLRWRLFNIPGKLRFSARCEQLRIKNLFATAADYLEAFRSILRSESWVLKPPPIFAGL